jgi:uncharacterized membrane protein
MASLRKYLLAGVVALAPLLVTVALINWLIEISDTAILLLPDEYRPAVLLGIDLPGIGIVLALLFIVVIGAVTTHFIGSHLMRLINRIMEHIPLVRTVYKATRQLLEAMFSDQSKAFSSVVMVQFPQQGSWVIGFVTGEDALPVEGNDNPHYSIFIPSTPLPTTGWLLFVEESKVRHLDISVEEGMKLVLSGGALPPDVEEKTKA